MTYEKIVIPTRNYVQHLCGVFGRFRSEKYYLASCKKMTCQNV